MMSVAVVQGASRGLGLQFCRHLLQARPELTVVATCRSPSKADHLTDLSASYDRLKIYEMDVCNEDSIVEASSQIGKDHGSVDLLVNCAGLLHPSGRGETSLKEVHMKDLQQIFATNTFGPLLVGKHFSQLLVKGQGTFGNQSQNQKERHRGVIANISAKVGSIADNGLGGWYGYRMSKTALNMATKNLSIELGRGRNRVLCASFHPGTVDTEFSRRYHKNVPKDKLFTPEHSVNCLMKIIDNLTVSDSGKFFSWDGTVIPY